MPGHWNHCNPQALTGANKMTHTQAIDRASEEAAAIAELLGAASEVLEGHAAQRLIEIIRTRVEVLANVLDLMTEGVA